MANKVGRAIYKRGALYFDEIGWAMIRTVAKRKHLSSKAVVIGAIKRYAKRRKLEKAENS